MRVLGLCSYPIESAATRFRLAQFVAPLSERGIELTIRPFLSATQFRELYESRGILQKVAGIIRPVLRRFGELAAVRKYDLILLQREAMFFGPGFFEWLFKKIGNVPVILDLDDATYVRYVSPTYGKAGSFLKFFGKTDNLIRDASIVVCGNRFIAEYVEAKGTEAVVIPTVVDTAVFCPADKDNEVPVIGWIGTHSTFPFLEKLFPVFTRLADEHNFILRIIGSGQKELTINGVNVETLDWHMEREVSDFQDLDIGLYPMFLTNSANTAWINGKSGFKAIQYLAVGVPFVMSPVGVCSEIGEPGKTHLNAETDEDWYNSITWLLQDVSQRREMGANGREHSLRHYRLEDQVEKLAQVLRGLCIRDS